MSILDCVRITLLCLDKKTTLKTTVLTSVPSVDVVLQSQKHRNVPLKDGKIHSIKIANITAMHVNVTIPR